MIVVCGVTFLQKGPSWHRLSMIRQKSGAYVKVREVLVVAVIIVKLGFPRIENQGWVSVLGSLS